MTASPRKRPTLKGDHLDRANVSQSTIEDPLYTALSPTSPDQTAWAAIGREFELTTKGYTFVTPDELEKMEGGQYLPREKHIGVYFEFDKDTNRIRQGQHVLMKVNRAYRQKLIDRDSQRMANLRPTRSDKAEQANLQEVETTTLKAEANL